MSARVSAIVVCFNEEDYIRDCLESLRWADEIVVVDSHSTDQTTEIAIEFTDRLYVRAWPGYREQKQFALDQARFEWVLNIDADERVSPDLRTEILRELSSEAIEVTGFYISRLVHYMGRWWRYGGWYPNYQLRLFRRDRARWGGVNPHEQVLVKGRTRRLSGNLLHFTYKDISAHLTAVNRLTDISSLEVFKSGRPIRRSTLIFRPLWRFFRSLVFNRGFLEGWPGVFVAATGAFYVFVKYAKAIELAEARSQGGESAGAGSS